MKTLDLRTPLGLLFLSLGFIMAVYGVFGNSSAYAQSLGVNVNLWWGAVQILFGAVVLLSRRLR
jgi:hypothetical protein